MGFNLQMPMLSRVMKMAVFGLPMIREFISTLLNSPTMNSSRNVFRIRICQRALLVYATARTTTYGLARTAPVSVIWTKPQTK